MLYYTQDHTTLGTWEGTNTVYGGTTAMGGVAVIAGTRTALFIGRNGLGTFCYGHGVDDQTLAGKPAADGVMNCYDPTSRDKGMHAYPYRYQIWAYDLADFAAVKAGTKQPWDVVPYGVWPFDLPIPEHNVVRIGGVAYDAQRQLLYVSQYRADHDGFAERPLIHTLKDQRHVVDRTAAVAHGFAYTKCNRTSGNGQYDSLVRRHGRPCDRLRIQVVGLRQWRVVGAARLVGISDFRLAAHDRRDGRAHRSRSALCGRLRYG